MAASLVRQCVVLRGESFRAGEVLCVNLEALYGPLKAGFWERSWDPFYEGSDWVPEQ